MPKAPKLAYYAVHKGRSPGVYLSWEECEAQVKGFHGAIYKKLATEAEARTFVDIGSSLKPPSSALSTLAVPPAVVSTSVPSTSSTSVASRLLPAVANVEEDGHGWDIVYSDGACKGNGKAGSVAGVGVWWGWNDSRNLAERCPGDQTNNRAELIAIVRALETSSPQRPLIIKTDSKYSIQCFESWLPKWSLNGFRTANGEPVKNAPLIRYLAALLYAREKAGAKVRFKHVRGHVGIEGNECADQLANEGALKPELSERDWAQLTRDVEKSTRMEVSGVRVKSSTAAPITSMSWPQQPPATTYVSSRPTTEQVALNKAELDVYADCLLDADQLLNDDLSDF